MALIAYLMEFKGNYGPHLIIVPNAVLVNWKVCVFYNASPIIFHRNHASAYNQCFFRDETPSL